MIELTLPYPPSVNHYWEHGRKRSWLSAKGRAFRYETVIIAKAGKHKKLSGNIAVHIEAYPPDKRRRDVDNITKGILDSLIHAGLYDDDSQVKKLCVTMNDPDGNPRVEVILK